MIPLKRIGLLTLLALALTATTAVASASASSFAAGTYPAQVKSEASLTATVNISPSKHYECKSPALTMGTVSAETTSLTTTSVAETNCTLTSGGESGPLSLGGCQVKLEPGTGSGGSYGGHFSLEPSGCGPVTLHASSNCNYTIDPSTVSGSATFGNSGKEVTVNATATGVHWSNSPSYLCGGSGTGAEIIFGWTIGARNEGGTQAGFSVGPSGLYLAGEAGGKVAPRFEALSYPASFASASASSFALKVTATHSLQCALTTVHGGISAATSALGLVPEYASCTGKYGATEELTKVFMNSCEYTLGALNVGPPYAGSLGVSCGGASAIEFKFYNINDTEFKTPICTVKLPPQGGQPGVSLANMTEGGRKGIAANASVSTVTFERTGVACGGTLKASTGAITYNTTMLGS